MARTCIDVPQTSGHAHLKEVKATAYYGQGTSTNDVLIGASIVLGIAVILLVCAIWAKWLK